MDFRLVATRQGSQQLEDRVDVGLDAGADVERADGVRCEGADVRIGHIADMHEITCPLALPVDPSGLAAQQAAAEDGEDARFSMRILTWSIDVPIAECGVRKAMHGL